MSFSTLEHLLFALLHDRRTAEVIRHCAGDPNRLRKRLDQYLSEEMESVPEQSKVHPSPTLALQRVLSRAAAHVEGSGRDQVYGHNILVAIFSESESVAAHYLQEEGISRLDVVSYLSHGISKHSATRALVPLNEEGDDPDDEEDPTAGADPLEAFTVNLNQLAESGRIDPLIGRHDELQRMMHILARRRKNNALLVGDSGVGKTAIVEGLARHIHDGAVPSALQNAEIYSLDLGALLAGTRYRGDFENRLKVVLQALQEKEHAILFIDEMHTVIGAGATSGGVMDASNMLKPALVGGTLRCIGSTTYQEYRSHLEKDRALMRRFQKIDVLEPSVTDTVSHP